MRITFEIQDDDDKTEMRDFFRGIAAKLETTETTETTKQAQIETQEDPLPLVSPVHKTCSTEPHSVEKWRIVGIAEYLGTSVQTIYNWNRKTGGQFIKVLGVGRNKDIMTSRSLLDAMRREVTGR